MSPQAGGEEPYEYLDRRLIDVYVDEPCGEGDFRAAAEVWLITGPPHREEFKYTTITCWDFDFDEDPAPPGDLTRSSAQAIIREQLPLPDVTLSPDAHGITGMEVWLWHEPEGRLERIDHDGDPSTPPKPGLTVTDRDGPYRISATVWIDRYQWDMGDQTVVVADRPGSEEDPAATHTYRTADQDIVVTAQVVWAGVYSWSSPQGSGSGVDMGELEVASAPRPYPVYEVHAVPADG